jgi:glycosyltransferase involved in cell wall biosynthesis
MKKFNYMKIVHILGYYPPHLGGMEYRTKDLSEYFANKGHLVQVITSDIGCKVGKLSSKKNLRIDYLKSFEFAHTPIMPSLLFKLLFLPKDSIVHLHISQAIMPEITYLVCKIRKLPYIAHIHLDIDASGSFGLLLPLYKKHFLSRVIKNADAVSVLTSDYKILISEKYDIPKNKITVIPNGTYFTVKNNTRKNLHTPIQLLFVGRLSVQKNVPLLIKALHICVYQYKLPLHLRIAGDGEKRMEITQLIKELKLERYVSLLGSVQPKDLTDIYATSDIFILPSLSESFGTVIIEAMASGIPVIATNIPAVKNIITNQVTGLLVNQNPKDVAKAIYQLSKNASLRKNIIANGLINIKKYSWETVANQYETIYRSIFLNKNK